MNKDDNLPPAWAEAALQYLEARHPPKLVGPDDDEGPIKHAAGVQVPLQTLRNYLDRVERAQNQSKDTNNVRPVRNRQHHRASSGPGTAGST